MTYEATALESVEKHDPAETNSDDNENRRTAEPAEPEYVLDADSHSTDPEVLTTEGRRGTRLIDPQRDGTDVSDLSKPLVECGCHDGCGELNDPLEQYHEPDSDLDFTFMNATTWSKGTCTDSRAMTVERAAEVFNRYARSNYNDPSKTSKIERELSNYRKVMERDRYARSEFGENLTTVMLSFRVSPVREDGGERQWANPLLLCDCLLAHKPEVLRRAKNIRRRVEDMQYAWVVTGTEKYATPHWHLYLWLDDPDDDVQPFDFNNAVETHTSGYNAFADDHPIKEDGDEKTVTVRHSPTVVDTEDGTTVETDDGMVLDMSPILREARSASDEPYHEATKGAVYVASQLPYFAGLSEDAHDADLQTAAIKWMDTTVRNRRWFGCSELPDSWAD